MSDKPLNEKVAIVTGAGTGIGRAIATTLAANGAAVVLAGRTESNLRTAQAEIEQAGGRAIVVLTDVGVEEQCVHLVAETVRQLGRIDILVNNATCTSNKFAGQRIAIDIPMHEWQASVAVGLFAPIILARECVPYMKQQQRAFIVNIGAIGTRFGYQGMGVYSAVKNANRAAMIVLSKELRKTTGIRVHVVNPGGVATERFQGAIDQGVTRPDLVGAKMIAPQEIADAVLFLVTRQGNGMIDEVSVRREDADYFCYP